MKKNMKKSIKECGFGPKRRFENLGSILNLSILCIMSHSKASPK